MLLGQKKDPHEPQRFVAEDASRWEASSSPFSRTKPSISSRCVALERKEGPFGLRLAAAAKPVAERVAEIVEQRRVLVVVAHERLHPAQDRAVLVAETVRDLPLQPQRQDVAGTLLQVMQLGADAQQEIVGAVELLALGRRQQLRIDESLRVGQPPLHFSDPDQVLVIAQAAAAVLHIRFLEKRRVARLFVPVALVAHAPGQVFLFMAVQAAPLEGLLKFREERLVAAEKARLQQRGLRPQVAVGLRHQFLHRARRVPDLKADVPEHIENMLDDVVHLRRVLRAVAGIEKKNVDVAVGIEFAAAESAHGQQRDARRRIHMGAQMRLPCAVPKMAQHDRNDVGALFA